MEILIVETGKTERRSGFGREDQELSARCVTFEVPTRQVRSAVGCTRLELGKRTEPET